MIKHILMMLYNEYIMKEYCEGILKEDKRYSELFTFVKKEQIDYKLIWKNM